MAREQRNDVDYFPHDCTHGRKMHIIENKYGNDGYAVWFKLLEQLGKANNHYIDISDEMTVMFLVSTFKIDEEKTTLILNDLSKLGAIDKTLYENHKVIWSQKFVNSISDVYRKRKLKLFTKDDIISEMNKKQINLPPISGGLDENTTKNSNLNGIVPESIPKVKYSKVNESKGEEILEEKKFDYKEELLKLVSNKILVNDFVDHRKIKMASLGETAFNSLKKECDDNKYSLEEALKISIEKNWTGFKVQWVRNIENDNEKMKNGKQDTTGIPSTSFPKNR